MKGIKGRWVLARTDDPGTSHAAADQVLEREGDDLVVRKGSQRHLILWAFSFGPNTDNGAADIADAVSNRKNRRGRQRAADLRKMEYIELTGETVVDPETGAPCRVSRITDSGLERLTHLGDPVEP